MSFEIFILRMVFLFSHGLDGLNGLFVLYGLYGLNGLFVLYGLDGLNGLFVLYGLDGLNGLCCCCTD